jgi:deoxyribonuclease (pyrimidine dimer)
VPVEELSDKHLGAEYRELPRVFALAQAAYLRGEDPDQYPQEYVLGPGHVKFFYNKLGYLTNRYDQIVEECVKRGRAVNFPHSPDIRDLMPTTWWQFWEPTPEALALNRQRIADRKGGNM